MEQKPILDRFIIPSGIVKRISSKWLYIIRTCWDNLFDKEIKSITQGQLYITDFGLILYMHLPPVKNQSSYFKDDKFSIQFLFTEIRCGFDIRLLLRMNKLEYFDFQILFENQKFIILITLQNGKTFSFCAKEVYFQYMFIKKIISIFIAIFIAEHVLCRYSLPTQNNYNALETFQAVYNHKYLSCF